MAAAFERGHSENKHRISQGNGIRYVWYIFQVSFARFGAAAMRRRLIISTLPSVFTGKQYEKD